MQSKLDPWKDAIVSRYGDGATLAVLASDYGTSITNLRYYLRHKCEVTLRAPYRGSAPHQGVEIEDAVLRDYRDGGAVRSIATARALPRTRVISILRRHGVDHRRRAKAPALRLPESREQIGYIAGLIDGEGTISVSRPGGRRRVYVKITNTSKPLIEWLQQFGGWVHWDKAPRTEHSKIGCIWMVSQAVDVWRLLNAVEPFLVIKQDRARAALSFLREEWDFH